MQLSFGEVAKILEAPSAAPERMAAGYAIDSRTIAPGQLFFAIRGPRLDGHAFVSEALERGAAGAVVEKGFLEKASPATAAVLIPVSSTLEALQRLAREVRRRWGRPLVAVTGSTGKTTTKELIAAVLAKRFRVLKSPGNLNNHYGLPLALLALDPSHQVAVMELGMSAAGEIAHLARIAAPEFGVVTNVAPVHLQFFDSVDSISRAKHELIENLVHPSTAILNYDDRRVRQFEEGFAGRVLTFGFEPGAQVRALEVHPGPGAGSRFRVKSLDFELEFELPLPGRHNVQNALAAIATGTVFNVLPEDIARALRAMPNLHQRGEILILPCGITLVNDSYNSNPLGMEAMLETLQGWPGAARRIVVAGEMLELGPHSPELHRGVGRWCAPSTVDWLVAVRGDARYFLEGAIEAGLPPERTRFFAGPLEAGEYCQSLVTAGDVVLIKGSRAVGLEKIVELLSSPPETPSAKRGDSERASER